VATSQAVSSSAPSVPSNSTPPVTAFAKAVSPAFGPTFLCEHCGSTTQFASISRVLRILGVSRSTIYQWMQRGLIHWRLLPSGRRMICQASLSISGDKAAHKETAVIGSKEPGANGHARS
jgi:hypothetical protein